MVTNIEMILIMTGSYAFYRKICVPTSVRLAWHKHYEPGPAEHSRVLSTKQSYIRIFYKNPISDCSRCITISTMSELKPPSYDQRPPYTSANPSDRPDASSSRSDDNLLPTFFPIRHYKSAPLVSISETKDYLLLLGAFAKMKDEVVSVPTDYSLTEASVEPNNEVKLAIFVKRAVYRFGVWWDAMESVRLKGDTSSTGGLEQNRLPPLDVLFIWHAYCLNPRIYRADHTCRPDLVTIRAFPLHLAARQVNPTSYAFTLTENQSDSFFSLTSGLSASLPVSTSLSDMLLVNCPFCGNINNIPWMTLPRPNEFRLIDPKTNTSMTMAAMGEGWAQTGFKANCSICDETFGRNELRVRKLADDLGRCLRGKHGGFLPQLSISHQTGFIQSSSTGITMNQRLLADLSSHFPNPSDPSARFDLGSGEMNEESKTRIRQLFQGGMKGVQEIWDVHSRKIDLDVRKNAMFEMTTKEFWGRYASTEARFGVDLTGATLRLNHFVDKIVKIGWTDPTFLSTKSNLIAKAISRYHRFLDLVSHDTTVLRCPTLDIDLIWHVHQLKTDCYRDDTSQLLANFLNHPDKVDEGSLEEAFISTTEAWKTRYDEPYSTAVLDALPSTHFWSRGKTSVPSKPTTPVDEEYRDITQASTHNSVWLVANKACIANREARERIRKQETKAAEKAWNKRPAGCLSDRTSKNYDPYLFFHQTPHDLGHWGCIKAGTPYHPLAGWGMGSECYPHDFHWKEMQRAPCLCERSNCCLGETCKGNIDMMTIPPVLAMSGGFAGAAMSF